MPVKTITRAEDAEMIMCIFKTKADSGLVPTYRELGRKLGLASSATVHQRIERLVDKGYLTHKKGQPRTLQTTPDGMEFAIANS